MVRAYSYFFFTDRVQRKKNEFKEKSEAMNLRIKELQDQIEEMERTHAHQLSAIESKHQEELTQERVLRVCVCMYVCILMCGCVFVCTGIVS